MRKDVDRTWFKTAVAGFLCGCAFAAAGADPDAQIEATAEHPAPNCLKPLGAPRFSVPARCYLRNWAVLGLWKYDMTRFETEHCVGHSDVVVVAGEAGLKPGIGGQVDGRTWGIYDARGAAEPHYFNASRYFGGMPNHAICFAAADVYCETEIRDARFLFGCSESARVYLNGALIYQDDRERPGRLERRGAEPDMAEVKGVALEKGWNLLLVKLGSILNGAGMYARFADADGNPIEAVCPEPAQAPGYLKPADAPSKGEVVAAIDLAGDQWLVKADPEAVGAKENWAADETDVSGWKRIVVPGTWDETLDMHIKGKFGFYKLAGLRATEQGLYNGIGWYRRTVVVPADWRGGKVFLELGTVSDYDWAYFNGVVVGATDYGDDPNAWWEVNRRYHVPDDSIKFGKENIIAVQVFDINAGGGLTGPEVRMSLEKVLE